MKKQWESMRNRIRRLVNNDPISQRDFESMKRFYTGGQQPKRKQK